MKKETKIQELERRIILLEKNQTILHQIYPQQQYNPNSNLHHHNGIACYNNPCY